MSRKSSDIWKHFNPEDNVSKVATCNLCQSNISFKSTISNLKLHLKRKHVTAFHTLTNTASQAILDQSSSSQYQQGSNENAMNTTHSETALASASIITSTATTSVDLSSASIAQKRQRTMASYIPKKIGLHESKQIDEALLHLLFWDYQPMSIVEDRGFLKYTNALNPSYKPPSRKTISASLIPSAYSACKEKLMEEVQREALTVCLTTDTWTSSVNDGYIAITIHYTTMDLEFKTVLLECAHYSERHTGELLAQYLKNTVETWGLTGKVMLAITDNANNIVNAINLSGWKHFGCYAHTLNLVIDDALKIVKDNLEKIKNIVAYFKRSSTATDKLVKYQVQQSGNIPKKLKQSVPTRWNSTFFMLQRFVELEEAVRATLALVQRDIDETLFEEDWIICTQLASILKPFEQATSKMSGEKYTTASMAIVVTRGLHKVCENLLKNQYKPKVSDVLLKLKEGLSIRFNNIEYHKELAMCTLLDPRFKMNGFTNKSAADIAKKRAIDMATTMIGNSIVAYQPTSSTEPPQPGSSKEISIWDDFDQEVEGLEPTSSPRAKAIIEMGAYLEDSLLARNAPVTPLEWWKNNRHLYPTIYKLFVKRGNFLATSVPCERIFSKAGYIVSERRTRLTTEKVRQLVFLNVNKK